MHSLSATFANNGYLCGLITNRMKDIIKLSDTLYEASKSIRILRSISWDSKVAEAFFSNKGQKLPVVEYPKVDVSETLALLKSAKKLIPKNNLVRNWAEEIVRDLEHGAYLLQSMGTKDFYYHSDQLYGSPKTFLLDGSSTSLDLANHFETMYNNLAGLDLGAPPEACILAQEVADKIEIEVNRVFGDKAPKVFVDDNLASNAIAGRRRIRIRREACFSDKDIDQLIHHEAFIHVATSINGKNQDKLKILGAAHPGTTKTQEGLAVFAEFITGTIDLDRLRRLSDRIVAIQMALDGADFIEVYRFYLEKTGTEDQAYESTRRVFRGGVMTGGAPFTKDIVYLDGLLRVHNFLRIMVTEGRADLMKLLFVGKLDIEDIPAIKMFEKEGLIKAPEFLPPWMQDTRFLLTYLAYSSFLNSVKLTKIKAHYKDMLA